MQRNVTQHRTIHSNIPLWYTVPYCTVLYYATLHFTMLYYNTSNYTMVIYTAWQYLAVWHNKMRGFEAPLLSYTIHTRRIFSVYMYAFISLMPKVVRDGQTMKKHIFPIELTVRMRETTVLFGYSWKRGLCLDLDDPVISWQSLSSVRVNGRLSTALVE